MAGPQGRKRVRRSPEEAKELILEAAVRVLSEYGPADSGLRAVAKEAGVSHALITHYFGTFDELAEVAVSSAIAQLRKDLIDEIMKVSEPTPAKVAEKYMSVVLKPWHGRLISWALFRDRDGSSALAKRIAPDLRRVVEFAQAIFNASRSEALSKSEAVSEEEAEALVISIWAVAVGYVAGRRFFWKALGRRPTAARDRLVIQMISRMTDSFARALEKA